MQKFHIDNPHYELQGPREATVTIVNENPYVSELTKYNKLSTGTRFPEFNIDEYLNRKQLYNEEAQKNISLAKYENELKRQREKEIEDSASFDVPEELGNTDASDSDGQDESGSSESALSDGLLGMWSVGSGVTTSGTDVTEWSALSGGLKTFTNSGGSYSQYLTGGPNGTSYIDLSGSSLYSSDPLWGDGAFAPNNSTCGKKHMFMVVKLPTTGTQTLWSNAYNTNEAFGGGTTAQFNPASTQITTIHSYYHSTGTKIETRTTNSPHISGLAGYENGEWALIDSTLGGDNDIYVNGTQYTSGITKGGTGNVGSDSVMCSHSNQPLPQPKNGFQIGGPGTNDTFAVAELILYSSIKTSSEAASIRSYLNDKYQLY